MIRLDGYYSFKTFPFLDKKEEKIIDYSKRAFLFHSNNLVSSVQKWTKSKNDTKFNIEDFDLLNNSEKYRITSKGFYILSYEGQPWETKFYYDKISDEEFISRQTGETIKFVPWEK